MFEEATTGGRLTASAWWPLAVGEVAGGIPFSTGGRRCRTHGRMPAPPTFIRPGTDGAAVRSGRGGHRRHGPFAGRRGAGAGV